eukprot:CAMPEP_0183326512 /NCGR_PEP_ID=MMETSP0160_2-20130417/82356_1 /TAXON_ID=2839 ORGANISM="Odontella Sinensis, Strain Grunow 1884" /NCGR_SAMPLE_ID=MMETSP0160_2 /ASSEMBLY_ACC=CAM_ASM_000250 /LENGTH=36 /DNA_ID= /DNA_START= /DNA_END= /DNA_ORIENTATION=
MTLFFLSSARLSSGVFFSGGRNLAGNFRDFRGLGAP